MKKYLALIALTAAAVQAAPITGNGDPLTNAALIGGTQEGFDTAASGLYSSFTSGIFTLTGVGAQFTIGTNYNGQYNTTGGKSAFNDFDFAPDAFRFDFAGGVSAFAFNWGAADYTWTLQTYNSSNTLLESINIAPTQASNAGQYFGATGNIAYATLTNNAPGDYVFIDRVTWQGSSSVPDSGATLSLLGLSLVGFAFLRRRFAA